MSDFPEKLYSVDPPNQSSDGLYMIVHTKKTDKCTVEYTRTPPTPPDEVCPVCGCTDWVTTSLYGTECIHCLHKKGMPVASNEKIEELIDDLIDCGQVWGDYLRRDDGIGADEAKKQIEEKRSRLLSLNKEVVDRINKTISAIDSVNDYLKNGQLEDAIIVVSPSDWESLKKDIEALGRG
jgi:hypothetical protein